MLLIVLRLALLTALVPVHLLAAPAHPTDPADVRHRRALLWSTRMCRHGLRLFGIRLRCRGRLDRDAPLKVCNHLSYLDAVILSAIHPMLMVTSYEIRDDPLLGRIAHAGGCEYVERRRFGSLAAECERLGRHLSHVPVLFFPEATSTDGRRMRPFRPAFFTAAIVACRAVQPLALRYRAIDGVPFSRRNHHRVCWYGDMTFAPHLLGVLATRRIDAELTFLDAIPATPGVDRKALARAAQARIQAALDHPLERDHGGEVDTCTTELTERSERVKYPG